MIKQYLKSYFRLFLFWMVFFTLFRFVFVVFNYSYSHNTPLTTLAESFFIGLRLDSSFTGYIMGITVLSQIIALIVSGRTCLKCVDYLSYVLIAFLSLVLLSDINLFSYWGKHLDLEALGFVQTPGIIMASLKWYEILLFIVISVAIISAFIFIYNKIARIKSNALHSSYQIKRVAAGLGVVLFSGALLIIPIRGSFGVAPINTGVAYFSSHRFANQTAINPLWNLAYSMKRMDVTKIAYHFMSDAEAERIFNDMMEESGNYPRVIKNDRPNVVVILLESFAAQVIEPLGGEAVTPNFKKLLDEGLFFSNIYAAANRSDKGLVATMAGYQVLPSYSIIRFPEKTNSLPFLPKKMKDDGYKDLSYLYGGDIKFKNMNSFVQQAGFEEVITIDDFPEEFRGEKWGVHDEYVFDRLLEEMKEAKEPFFKFFFTLSSHEPFIVPMERMFDIEYYNSVAYTDKCLGEFMDEVKASGLWDNTLFVLIADHGATGPTKLTMDQERFYHIPMLWTGGALSVQDSVVNKIGSQTDMAKTLLSQLNIEANDMKFSKNILDEESHSFAFFSIPFNGMAMVEKEKYQAYSNRLKRFIHMEGEQSEIDSLKAKAYLQVLYNDSKNR
jgi:phosphoglycerol transferase MdoB-like AlkP superfamily enzyme